MQSSDYRISIKALILDKTRTKFLAIKNDKGKWNLPGGGIDPGETIEECVKREVMEETGLRVTFVASKESYFISGARNDGVLTALPFHITSVADFNYTKTPDCVEMRFIEAKDMKDLDFYRPVNQFGELFDPKKHVSDN